MDAKKIYNLNFWHATKNYGANMTAFALQRVLEKLGFDAELVNNRIDLDAKAYKNTSVVKFFKKYLKINSDKPSAVNLLNDSSQIFIAGSDQIFRPRYTDDKMQEYLLDFVKPEFKKLAFAASFGLNKTKFLEETPEDVIAKMRLSLRSFDFVSVREKSGVEICRDVFGIDAQWVIDPVFILDKSCYEDLIKNSTVDYTGKLVSYVLDKPEGYSNACQYLSDKYNSECVELSDSGLPVENWLAAIKNCKILLTDSFHGVCFAIIFNKPFICLSNKTRGGARFESIFEMLGIKDESIQSYDEILRKNCIFNVDYECVNEKIAREAEKGIEVLKTALNTPVKINNEKIAVRRNFLETELLRVRDEATIKFQLKKVRWRIFCILPVYAAKYSWKLLIYWSKQIIGIFKRH